MHTKHTCCCCSCCRRCCSFCTFCHHRVTSALNSATRSVEFISTVVCRQRGRIQYLGQTNDIRQNPVNASLTTAANFRIDNLHECDRTVLISNINTRLWKIHTIKLVLATTIKITWP